MANIRNQSIRGAIYLYSGQGIGLVNKLLLFPVVFVGKEEFWGFLALSISLSGILANLGQVGFAKSIQMYLPVHPDKRDALLRYIFLVSTFTSLVFAGLIVVLRNQIVTLFGDADLILENFHIILVLFLSQLLYELGVGVFNSLFRSHIPLLFNNVIIRVFTLSVLLCKYWMEFSIETFLVLVATGYLVNNLLLLILGLRKISFKWSGESSLNPDVRGQVNRYSLFMFAMILTSQVATQLDVLMAGHLLVLSSIALYDFSKNLMSIVDMPARVLNASSFATVRTLMAGGEVEKVRTVYNKATFFQFGAGLVMATLIVLNLHHLTAILPSERGYEMILPVVTVLIAAKLFDLLTGMNWAIISVSDHYVLNLIISTITLVVSLPVQYVLVQRYGLEGVAGGFLVSVFVMNVLRSAVVYRKFRILPWSRYWGYLMVYLIFSVGAWFFSEELGSIAVSVIFLALTAAYSAWLYKRGYIEV